MSAQPVQAIRVLIADHARVVLFGLREVLKGSPDIEIVGIAQDTKETLRLVDELMPDVVVLGFSGGDSAALDELRGLRARHETLSIVVYSPVGTAHGVRAALQGGASGYVVSEDDPHSLIEAVHRTHEGHIWLSPLAQSVFVIDAVRPATGRIEITARQLQILQLIAAGLKSPEIATRLGIRPRTVHTHRSRLMHRIGVHSSGHLVVKAIEMGLIRPGKEPS